MKTIDINEIVGTTFYTIDRIREVWGKMAGDALILYFEYIKKGRVDWTNQPRATDKYMMKWLWRGRSKFLTAKTTLKELWLIEAIPWRNNEGLMSKRYTRVNYIMPQEKIQEAMNQKSEFGLMDKDVDVQKSENRLVEDGECVTASDHQKSENRLVGEINVALGNPSSDHQKSENPPSGEMTTNALSNKNKMLKVNEYNTTYYMSAEAGQKNDDENETKLDCACDDEITPEQIYNEYTYTKRPWTLSSVEKATKWFSQKKLWRALLEIRLYVCEYKLWMYTRKDKDSGKNIVYIPTCAGCIARMSDDEEVIMNRVDTIVKWFSTFKHKTPKLKEKWDNNIKEWFKDYLPEEKQKTTLDWVLEYDNYAQQKNTKMFLDKYWENKYANVQARRLEYKNNWEQPLRSWQ